jgi:hypothetical protein
MPRSSKWSLLCRFSDQNFVCASHLSHVYYMPIPSFFICSFWCCKLPSNSLLYDYCLLHPQLCHLCYLSVIMKIIVATVDAEMFTSLFNFTLTVLLCGFSSLLWEEKPICHTGPIIWQSDI